MLRYPYTNTIFDVTERIKMIQKLLTDKIFWKHLEPKLVQFVCKHFVRENNNFW